MSNNDHVVFLLFLGLLGNEILDTADGLHRLNDCFDILNSSRFGDGCRNKRAFSARTEDEHTRILLETRDWLSRWKTAAATDSVRGLQLTINAVIQLWVIVRRKMKFMMTRRLCQDGLENFFGAIRQVGRQNDHPNPTQFRQAFRKTAVNSVMSASEHTNCEPDADRLFAALTSVSARSSRPQPAAMVQFHGGPQPPVMDVPVDTITENVLAYIAGYLIAKSENDHSCSLCVTALRAGRQTVQNDRELLIGLKSFTGLRSIDVGSLRVPSDQLYQLIAVAYETTEAQGGSIIFGQGVLRCLVECIINAPQYTRLLQSMCGKGRLRQMVETFVRMQLYGRCKAITSAAAVPGVNRLNRKLLKLTPRV